jgi:hypothetical protein
MQLSQNVPPPVAETGGVTIPGRFFTYTPHTVASTIPATLENLNAGFTGLRDDQRAGLKALLNGRLLVFGFKPIGQNPPVIQLTAGTVVTPEGMVVEYDPGELAYIPHEGVTNYLYLAANYTVDISTSLPEDALVLLGTCELNEDGSELVFDLEVFVETCNYNAQGQLESVEFSNGARMLKAQYYIYDQAGRLILAVETLENDFTVKEWAYNASGLPERVGVSYVGALSLVLGDSLFFGIGETAVQGFD